MNGFVVYLMFLLIVIVVMIIISVFLSYKSKDRKENRKYKFKNSSEDLEKVMSDLIEGKIKCHTQKNSAPPYDVGNWIKSMNSFFKKPIYKQLMKMKGHDIDE